MTTNHKHQRNSYGFSGLEVAVFLIATVIATIAISGMVRAQSLPGEATVELAKDEIWMFRGVRVVWSNEGAMRVRVVEPMGLGFADSAVAEDEPERGVIFEGWQINRRLVGRAEMTVEGCPAAFTYGVRGWLSPEGDKAALTGTPPLVENCRIVGPNPFGPGSTLVFQRAEVKTEAD